MTPKRPGSQVGQIPVALIYTRVSSEEQEREGVSLAAQVRTCRRYCADKGWGIEAEHQDVLSGTRDDRPGYQRLLAQVRELRAEGRSAVVVVSWLHRLGRKVAESVRCREEFKKLGVPIHSTHEGGEVDDLRANIMSSVAQYEVQQLGERVSAALHHIQENGWYKIGPMPWGYTSRAATEGERKLGSPMTVVLLDDVTAPYAREAFTRAVGGQSVHSVAQWAAKLPEDARGGKALTYATIAKLLRSPTYIARQRWGDDDVLARPVGHWPALVDDAMWQRVAERFASHAKMPHQASGRHLLTGMLRCSCGSRMVGQAATVRNGAVVYAARYRCKGYDEGAPKAGSDCKTEANMKVLDAAVIQDAGRIFPMLALLENRTFRAKLQQKWQALQTPPATLDVARQIRHQEAEAAKAQQRLQALTYKLLDNAIDDATYKAMKGDIERTRDAATAEVRRLRGTTAGTRPLPPLETVLARIGGWDEALAAFDIASQRAILGELIDWVEPVRTERLPVRGTPWGQAPLIHWTPAGDALRDVAAVLAIAA